jgi:iron(III) transport system permease protein
VIPSYIGALAYIAAFGPRGMLQQTLAPFGVTQLPSIYGFFGAWLAISLFTYPYVVLPVRSALLNMDPALEETARSLGSSRWQVFFRVTLPQLRPALAVGMLLSALYTLSDFGAVALMQFDAFTRVIFTQYTSSFDRNLAAVLSLVLVAITLGLLFMERKVAASQRNYRAGVGATRRIKPTELGRWRIPALIFCALLVGIGLVIPLGVLLTWLVQSIQIGRPQLTLFTPAVNAVSASGLAALVVGFVSFPLAMLAVRSKSRSDHWLIQITYLGNGLPGLVIALSLVFFAANYLPSLYQTLPILVMGYAIRFLPLSIGATRSALTQLNPRYEEAGRSLGLNSWQIMWRIMLPLVRTGVLGGMALVFLSAMKELPTTLLLSPTGFSTLATQIWTARSAARFTEAALPALLLIAVSAFSLIFILRDSQKQSTR